MREWCMFGTEYFVLRDAYNKMWNKAIFKLYFYKLHEIQGPLYHIFHSMLLFSWNFSITHCSKEIYKFKLVNKDGFRPPSCWFTTLNPNYSIIRQPFITKLYSILDIRIFDYCVKDETDVKTRSIFISKNSAIATFRRHFWQKVHM